METLFKDYEVSRLIQLVEDKLQSMGTTVNAVDKQEYETLKAKLEELKKGSF